MKKLLLYGLAATALFALSATVSLYLLPGKPVAADSSKAGAAKTSESPGKSGETEPAEKLRPLVKSATPDTEQTAQLLQALRDREKAVKEKEDQTSQRRKQMELVYQDIRGERAVLDDLRKQISEELHEVGKKLVEVDKKSGDLDKQKQTVGKDIADLQKRQLDLVATEQKNIDKLAKVYESMAPESAARIIQQMSDTGRLDTAVKVLSLMKERQAAGILDQLTDPGLAGQITEKIRLIKRNPAASNISSTVAPPGP